MRTLNPPAARIAAAIFALILPILGSASCASAPKEVPAGLSAQELVQRAQEATDGNDYAAAVAFYKALEERFGTEPAFSATAQYEIAFIDYKQGRYAEAQAGFETLLARYAGAEKASLPPQFKILCEKMMEKIQSLRSGKK
jgi:outer membrane protein assembly factor BamD (BamD/ComL family)